MAFLVDITGTCILNSREPPPLRLMLNFHLEKSRQNWNPDKNKRQKSRQKQKAEEVA